LEKLFRRFTKIFGMLGARFNVDSFFFWICNFRAGTNENADSESRRPGNPISNIQTAVQKSWLRQTNNSQHNHD
jgi:hypothetical protein